MLVEESAEVARAHPVTGCKLIHGAQIERSVLDQSQPAPYHRGGSQPGRGAWG